MSVFDDKITYEYIKSRRFYSITDYFGYLDIFVEGCITNIIKYEIKDIDGNPINRITLIPYDDFYIDDVITTLDLDFAVNKCVEMIKSKYSKFTNIRCPYLTKNIS